jgi:hypothetical protein
VKVQVPEFLFTVDEEATLYVSRSDFEFKAMHSQFKRFYQYYDLHLNPIWGPPFINSFAPLILITFLIF